MINVMLTPPAGPVPAWPPGPTPRPYMRSRARRGGCVAQLVLLVVVLLFAGAAYSFIQTRSPYFFDNLIAGGYARLDQTFDAQVDGTNLLQSPIDIAIDNNDSIYVLDGVRQVAARFDPAGNYVSNWRVGGPDKQLGGLSADKAGDLFVVVNGQLVRYDLLYGQSARHDRHKGYLRGG